ncbi:uncharacterized protein NDAI_0A02050 [Naumovozyma dairenensis CBS 421]|uniref:Major facilitator superfamily (MFS) profile domain-containing protein n=1 Tax=Naumovozyma dairenensis (strain ATCC 10597 / BCRC 20456 / CBS 421 / NBRC 0211 / NRRL Y-12639) TaxID=1071378 RepID=G0W3H5_NAUDC|nr:hypothetical protein NDAI_0A02050 [Naumovozyma dairenensis CBS 421]CCD22363.1 hypothetical protein NDAI_0A02050 [Naumovozyma dairenensis CBS 421]
MSSRSSTSSSLDPKTTKDEIHEQEIDSVSSTEESQINYDTGVINIEVYSEYYSTTQRRLLFFFSIFLTTYCYTLDKRVRSTFQTEATSSYKNHSLMSTVTCITTVISAAGQIAYARAADIFGRTSLVFTAIFFYVIGTVVESQATNITRYAVGACFYSLGHAAIVLALEVLAADFSNLNYRILASAAPMLPNVINTWISGNITSDIGDHWQWGIGMWAIIFPVCCIPLLFCLFHMRYLAQYKHNRRELRSFSTIPPNMTRMEYFIDVFFWRLDILGLLLGVIFFACVLIPFTLAAKATDKWKSASIIVPEVIGWLVALPLYIFWEWKFAKFPLTPWNLVKDRGVYGGLLIALFLDFAYYVQSTYKYTVLLVSFDTTVLAATRTNNMFTFVGVITANLLGIFVAKKLRRTKGFIFFGISMYIVSTGLLYRYRIGAHAKVGTIVACCLLGFGNGFLKFPARASIQAAAYTHKNLAIITSLFLALGSIGEGFGSSVAGAIWSNRMEVELSKYISNQTAVSLAYESPTKFIKSYKWESPERIGLVQAYSHVTNILYIVTICLCIPLYVFALLLRDRELADVVAFEQLDGQDEIIQEKKTEEVPIGQTIFQKVKSKLVSTHQ